MVVELAPSDIRVSVRGEIPAGAVDYARDRLVHVIACLGDPVLYSEVELDFAPDPARERPALVEATVDVNGKPVRAHIAAGEIMEAIDLMSDRLARRLERHEARLHRRGRELHRTGEHQTHEWHHGDLPTQRPEYFPRPYDERELVRTKSFALAPMTIDEAAFDLDRLGHDFYLFRELTTGADAVIFFLEDGGRTLGLQQPEGTTGDPAREAAVPVTTRPPAPSLDQREAIERLESGNETFVFYTDPDTGRGRVVYHRYDGHWGMVRAG
jgi:ribosome-associated translation inhibitor RaiA